MPPPRTSSSAPTPDAGGYWVVDSAGDVYGFGDAGFYGSLPGRLSSLVKTSAHDVVTGHQATVPVTGFAPTADGRGYWMVATDGSLYTFGDAPNYGSLRDIGLTPPPVTVNGYIPPSTVGLSIPLANVSAFVRTPDGGGYWFTSLNGGVFSFGDAQFHGSVPGRAFDHRQCQRPRLAVFASMSAYACIQGKSNGVETMWRPFFHRWPAQRIEDGLSPRKYLFKGVSTSLSWRIPLP